MNEFISMQTCLHKSFLLGSIKIIQFPKKLHGKTMDVIKHLTLLDIFLALVTL